MRQAYRAAAHLLRQTGIRMDGVDIVVVRGTFDHCEEVLSRAGWPFRLVDPAEFASMRLRREQVVIVNCGTASPAPQNVSRFVQDGGTLITTDWALNTTIETAFPGYIRYNHRPTSDTVVPVQVAERGHPLLDGVFDAGTNPMWWLERGSYPIEVLHPDVTVLIRSNELGRQWGEKAVAVTFRYGAGVVLHMISHCFLKRVESRYEEHRLPWTTYARDLGIRPRESGMFSGVTRVEVEAAYTSLRLLSNAIVRLAGACHP